MAKYTHQFVEQNTDFIGYGLDRETNEKTVICFLQMFSDDTLMEYLVSKMTDDELEEIFNLVSELLRKHLTEDEYHQLFLKTNR